MDVALNGDVDRHAGVIWWIVHGRERDPGHHNGGVRFGMAIIAGQMDCRCCG